MKAVCLLTELHTFLRLANASLVVKVIDACNSGTTLIKRGGGSVFQAKDSFVNLIQIASCLDSQESLTGDPLSKFTASFRAAALRKDEGAVYYTDIINTIRDEYMEDNLQTPFFVSQYTGREKFVDDAKCLDGLRHDLRSFDATALNAARLQQEEQPAAPTLLQRLQAADEKVANPELISSFTEKFFDFLTSAISKGHYAQFFNSVIIESSYYDDSSEEFILSILAKEKRSDEFVTATKESRLKNPSSFRSNAFMQGLLGADAYEDISDLTLNYPMKKAQLRISLIPKFTNLQKIVLIASCAPSLDCCYVFEYSRRYMMTDFGRFKNEGVETARRWWKAEWKSDPERIATMMGQMLAKNIQFDLEAAEQRLASAKEN